MLRGKRWDSPFEEVKVIELNGTPKWILWILSLLCIHVICHYNKVQGKGENQTPLSEIMAACFKPWFGYKGSVQSWQVWLNSGKHGHLDLGAHLGSASHGFYHKTYNKEYTEPMSPVSTGSVSNHFKSISVQSLVTVYLFNIRSAPCMNP